MIRSDPPASATLDSAPTTITLWFSEPLEPRFSGITLLDAQGNTLDTPPSAVDSADPQKMTLAPGDLPDGLYTVSWRSLSAADGHASRGSFAFVIGSAALSALSAAESETIPLLGALLRGFDLLSLSVLVGSIGFLVFLRPLAAQDKRSRRLIWIGWALVGVAGILLLPYQVSQATGMPFLEALPSIGTLLSASRFGQLWIGRMIAWLIMGVALVLAAQAWRWNWAALMVSTLILLTHSLNSHSSAMHDPLAMVLGDWLHLLTTTLWIGGLIQFANVLIPVRRDTTALAALVGGFSNYARVCVAALVVSGAYLAWMHVGTIEALLRTLYGQALLIKLILFAPLLGVAATNLLVTQRRLLEGRAIWAGRLRGLIGVEITLTVGILAAVGVMTSLNPARSALASRVLPPDHTVSQFQVVDDIHVHFDVSPGWVGENEFFVTLYDADGAPLNDASLIRVRFDNLTQSVGQSEARPQLVNSDGEYSVTGTNLSAPGQWRARVTVARPNQFDVLADFTLDMQLAPVPAGLDMREPLPGHAIAEMLAGMALLAIGGFFGVQAKFWRFSPVGLVATVVVVVGLIFILSGGQHGS